MSDNLLQCVHFLQLLGSPDTSKAQKVALINTVSKAQLNSLSELSMNILNGNISITTEEAVKLRKFKSAIRILSSRKHTIPNRREVVTFQLIQALLPPSLKFVNSSLQNVES